MSLPEFLVADLVSLQTLQTASNHISELKRDMPKGESRHCSIFDAADLSLYSSEEQRQVLHKHLFLNSMYIFQKKLSMASVTLAEFYKYFKVDFDSKFIFNNS